MIKGWTYSKEKSAFSKLGRGLSNDYGFVYAIRIEVAQGFTLLKIGATRNPSARFSSFNKRTATLFCVSPAHTNFWESEEILHKAFSKYRVPARPGKGVQAEFFNLSMPYFLEHLPSLNYST